MKRIISLLIILIITLSVFTNSLFAASATSTPAQRIKYKTCGDFEYKLLYDGTACIMYYLGSSEVVDIPRRLDAGYVVTAFSGGAFVYSETVKSITIPDTVTRVSGSCSTISEIKVDENNKVYDSRENCNAIIETETNTLVTGCMNTVIPNGVASIADGAFAYCENLTEITIPDSVTTIEQGAFKYCIGLTTITIPESVTRISKFLKSPFEGCYNLSEIIVDENNKVYDSRDNCNAIIETKTNTLILGCRGTVIPNGVTSVSDDAFYDCDRLFSITIPQSVTSIGKRAFGSCDNLSSVTITEGVTSIGESAFLNCDGLLSIRIPQSVTSIGESAFWDCDNLSYVITEGVTVIGESAFGNCDNLSSVIITGNGTNIGESAFGSCEGLSSVTIREGVASIGESAFGYCEGLTSVTISEGVTSIGNYAFLGCILTSLTIPKSVTSIGDGAFNVEVQLYVYKDSYAYEYAKSNDYEFVVIDDAGNEEESNKKSTNVSAIILIIALCVFVLIILVIVICVLLLIKKIK